MLRVYCLSRCTTCKKALKWLDDNGIKHEVIDIKENHPDEGALLEYYAGSGLPLKRFWNTSGIPYREMGFSKKLPEMSEEEQFALLATDGTKARSMPDTEDKLAILKKAFSLYRGRLFIQGEADIGTWLMGYTAHYNQVFVDITTELLRTLGHHKDFRCIMDYAPMAQEKEPGMQEAYFWMVRASETMGNSVAKEKALEKAKEELEKEEYERLLLLLKTAQ